MRNLLNFLARYNNLILFLIFEVIAIYLAATSNSYHNTRIVKGVRSVTSRTEERITNAKNYFRLRQVNLELAAENAMLRNSLGIKAVKGSAEFRPVSDSTRQQQYEYIPSTVVNNSVNRQKNFFTIDRGWKDGIGPDMAVTCSKGVAGIIVSSTENYSVAMSLLHVDFRLSCRLRSTGYFGSLTWEGQNDMYAYLSEIPQHVTIAVGDTVETTSYSAIFPEGVMAGTVEGFEKSGGDFYRVKVKLSTDFRSLTHVSVIRNLKRTEQLKTEQAVR